MTPADPIPPPVTPEPAPGPEGMSEERLADLDQRVKSSVFASTWFSHSEVEAVIAECRRLRADGATLQPQAWLRAFDELLRQHGIPDGLIVRDFTAWAARVMKGARIGMDEALAAHSASFGALQTLSAALFDGEVDDYAVLAEKIIARVRQLEADGATLRERVRKLESTVREVDRLTASGCLSFTNTINGIRTLLARAPKEPTPHE